MSSTQKGFLFKLSIASLALLVFTLLVFFSKKPLVANAAWALMALLIFEGKVKGKEQVDEREEQIVSRSSLISYNVFWAVFVLGCTAVYFTNHQSISSKVILYLPIMGFWFLETVRSSVGLYLYKRM